MRLGLFVACVSMAAGACANTVAPQQPDSSRTGVMPGHNVIQVGRRDQFQLGSTTRVCIEATIEPALVPRIEASGENVTTRHLAFRMSEAIGQRLRAAGLVTYVGPSRQPRVSAYITDPADRSCIEQGNNVLVRLQVRSASAGGGYRVEMEASQGQRRYESSVERRDLITLHPAAREGIPLDAETFPGLSGPFWDVTRDAHRLSTLFVSHLFEGIHL